MTILPSFRGRAGDAEATLKAISKSQAMIEFELDGTISVLKTKDIKDGTGRPLDCLPSEIVGEASAETKWPCTG